MNLYLMGLLLALSSLFSCQQKKGDFRSLSVDAFNSYILDENG